MATDQIMAGKMMGKRQRVANGDWRLVKTAATGDWRLATGQNGSE
jgi:hypothetical protein